MTESAPIGSNAPPTDLDTTEAALSLTLELATKAIKARLLDIHVALVRMPQTITPEIEGAVSDQIRQAKIALGELEAVRERHKKPYDALGKVVQEHVRPITRLISEGPKAPHPGILEQVEARWTAYLVAKQQRELAAQVAEQMRRDQEAAARQSEAEALQRQAIEKAQTAGTPAERKAAGATAAAAVEARVAAETAQERAAAPAAPVGRARGHGSAAHLTSRWRWRITDLAKLPEHYVTRLVNQGAVDRAVAAGLRDIPGLEIYEHKSAVTVDR